MEPLAYINCHLTLHLLAIGQQALIFSNQKGSGKTQEVFATLKRVLALNYTVAGILECGVDFMVNMAVPAS